MNLRLFLIFSVLSLFISSFSCSNKSNRSRKPAVNMTVSSVHQKIIYGDDVNIAIAVKLKDGELKDTQVFVDSVLVISSPEDEFTQTMKKFKSLGKHTVKVVATKTDGVEGTYYKTFEVYSDISPEPLGYEVIQTYPHNPEFFTQGLEIHKGFLYEGTGEIAKSAIYKTDLKTGKTLQSYKLADRYWGEGITIMNNRIFQLTYKHKTAFVYDLQTIAPLDSFTFSSTEGWGLTNDGKNLVMSDGTNVLTYIDPVTYKKVKTIQVYDDKEPIFFLNELEYSDGFIYANVWTTFLIVKIELATGKVVSKIHMDGILKMTDPTKPVDVLNGIAIDPATGKMYVTGKYYPRLYEIRPVKKE